MNKLQQWIEAKKQVQGGFLMEDDWTDLAQMARLFQVLVRCGGCRFTCAIQDLEHLIFCVEAGGDYIRDVSLPTGSFERAADWRPDPATPIRPPAPPSPPKPPKPASQAGKVRPWRRPAPDEGDYGGAFDGNQVTSDADPGL